MFFKNKLEIWSNRIPIDFLKQFICIYPNNLPDYFKNIPKTYPFRVGRNFNIRTCSGFINFFRRSVVLKSPFDISLEIIDNKIYCEFGSGSYSNENNLQIHSQEQFLKWVNKDIYKIISKFIFGIYIKSNNPILVTNPWWAMNDFEIIPGILNAKNPLELNLFLPIKKDTFRITIKQGTPLCMLHFESNKDFKIVFKDKKINTRYYNGMEYLKINFKNMILGSKFLK